MSLPKHVREAVKRFRQEGLEPEVETRTKHFRIRCNGEVVLTLHQGAISRNTLHHRYVQGAINRAKRELT